MKTLSPAKRKELTNLMTKFDEYTRRAYAIEQMYTCAKGGNLTFHVREGGSIELNRDDVLRIGPLLVRDYLESANNISERCQAEFGIRLVDEEV